MLNIVLGITLVIIGLTDLFVYRQLRKELSELKKKHQELVLYLLFENHGNITEEDLK